MLSFTERQINAGIRFAEADVEKKGKRCEESVS
jgi:hypothetical protein